MVNAGWKDSAHVTEDQIKNLSIGLNKSQLKARMFGEPYVGEGRIFPIETDKVQYETSATTINKEWRHLIAIDWGFTNDPAALIFSAYDEDNDKIYILEEWKGWINSADELAKKIWAMHPTAPVAWPRDGGRTGGFKGGETPAMELSTSGCNLLPKPFLNPRGLDGKRNHFIEPGLTEINARFETNRLVINQDCTALLSEIDKYSYEDGKIKNKQDDHLIDAMRYNVMSQIQLFGDPLGGSQFKDDFDPF